MPAAKVRRPPPDRTRRRRPHRRALPGTEQWPGRHLPSPRSAPGASSRRRRRRRPCSRPRPSHPPQSRRRLRHLRRRCRRRFWQAQKRGSAAPLPRRRLSLKRVATPPSRRPLPRGAQSFWGASRASGRGSEPSARLSGGASLRARRPRPRLCRPHRPHRPRRPRPRRPRRRRRRRRRAGEARARAPPPCPTPWESPRRRPTGTPCALLGRRGRGCRACRSTECMPGRRPCSGHPARSRHPAAPRRRSHGRPPDPGSRAPSRFGPSARGGRPSKRSACPPGNPPGMSRPPHPTRPTARAVQASPAATPRCAACRRRGSPPGSNRPGDSKSTPCPPRRPMGGFRGAPQPETAAASAKAKRLVPRAWTPPRPRPH